MTKKKQTNSSSSFEDFELDNEKLKKILDAENSPEFIDDYLNGFLNTVTNHLSKTIESLKINPKTIQKKDYLSHFKTDFPKPEVSANPPKKSKPSIKKQAPRPETDQTLQTKTPKKDVPITNKQPPTKPNKKTFQPNDLLIKPTRTPDSSKKKSTPSRVPDLAKNSNNSTTEEPLSETRPSINKDALKKETQSMDEAIERLKKREEEIKKLLDNNKGSLN